MRCAKGCVPLWHLHTKCRAVSLALGSLIESSSVLKKKKKGLTRLKGCGLDKEV